MLNPIASLCVFLVEAVIAGIFFANLFEFRVTPWKCILVGLVLALGASSVNLLSGNIPGLNALSTIIMMLVLSLFCFRCTVIQSVFHTVVLMMVNSALETFVIVVSSYVTGSGFQDYNNDSVLFLFQAVTCKTLYLLCVLILVRIINRSGECIHVPWSFLLYPAICLCCHFIFWRVCVQPDFPYESRLLLGIASGFLFLSTLLLYMTYYHQLAKEQETMQVKSELLRLQTEESYYRILEEQNHQLMLYAHDAKKHLAAIQALTDDSRINGYLTQLSNQLRDYAKNCHSGNKLLDVMIHKYQTACDIQGIELEYDVKLCNLAGIADLDLVAILGNLMDNALRAAAESKGKNIRLETLKRNGYSVVIVANSCDTAPIHQARRLFSTKSNPTGHGFGLKSAERAVKQYMGDLDWNFDISARLFTVTVMLDERNKQS